LLELQGDLAQLLAALRPVVLADGLVQRFHGRSQFGMMQVEVHHQAGQGAGGRGCIRGNSGLGARPAHDFLVQRLVIVRGRRDPPQGQAAQGFARDFGRIGKIDFVVRLSHVGTQAREGH